MSTAGVHLTDQALSRIAGSLRSSARFTAYVKTIADFFYDAQQSLKNLDYILDIDTQEGVNLDIIGRIVGQSRRLLGAVPRSFFGFRIQSSGSFQLPAPYGDRARVQQGAGMYDRAKSRASSSLMDDASYRFALKARIIKNTCRPDGVRPMFEKMYDILKLIFTDANTGTAHNYPLWIDDGGMHVEVGIGSRPAARQVALLLGAGIFPIPQGASFNATYWNNNTGAFGFKNKLVALPMGDRGHSTRGGPFAERVTSNASS